MFSPEALTIFTEQTRKPIERFLMCESGTNRPPYGPPRTRDHTESRGGNLRKKSGLCGKRRRRFRSRNDRMPRTESYCERCGLSGVSTAADASDSIRNINGRFLPHLVSLSHSR